VLVAGVPVAADGVGVLEVLDIEIGVVCLGAVESLLLVAGVSVGADEGSLDVRGTGVTSTPPIGSSSALAGVVLLEVLGKDIGVGCLGAVSGLPSEDSLERGMGLDGSKDTQSSDAAATVWPAFSA
jgi:hypothetical protein